MSTTNPALPSRPASPTYDDGEAARDAAPRADSGGPAGAPAAAEAPAASPPKKPMSPAKKLVAGGVVVVLAAGAFAYWLHDRHFEETDDAQIDGNVTNVSPRVSGTIESVAVVDGQRVTAGTVLAVIDARDLNVALAQARAEVAQAQAQLAGEDPSVPIIERSNETLVANSSSDLSSASASVSQARAKVDQLAAQVVQAEATNRTAQLDRERADALIKQEAISRREYDTMTNNAAASAANLDAVRNQLAAEKQGVAEQQARLASTRSRLDEVRQNAPRQVEAKRASVLWRQASLDAAKAALAQAELNASYAKITAPVTGIVGKKSVNVGDRVSPGQQLMALAENEGVWVTANYRETQLELIKPGQTVDVRVDAYGMDLHGKVESIGGATGSRFSVLPPENASGNYVKVVQRIPVRIVLDPGQAGLDRLRPGMSVEPKVTVR